MKLRYILLASFFLASAIVYPADIAGKTGPRAHVAYALFHLRSRLDRIFLHPQFSHAQWGIMITSLDRPGIVYERNAARLCMPASNNKIITVSAALLALGPQFRYQTRVLKAGSIVETSLKGDLVIVGAGDPTGAARFHSDDPYSVFREWSALLKARGIVSIEGAIIGDEAAFEEKVFGNGWEADDLGYGYAAPVSAFQFNENQIEVEIMPGELPGTAARLKTIPLENYLLLKNHVTTLASGTEPAVQIGRSNGEDALALRGVIPHKSNSIVRSVAVQSPTRYYLQAFREVLKNEGVDVSKCEVKAARGVDIEGLTPLWTYSSLPLKEIIKPLLKTSQNLYAETLVRTLGLSQRHEGSFAAGKEIVEETLARMAIKKGTYAYADGSGLSRLNLLSADLLIQILSFMSKQECFQYFYEALPIAGVDGTLAGRMQGTKAANNVHAKTGAFANVRSLSGYVRTADGELLAFSMIANNFLVPGQVVEAAQDAALVLLANFRRDVMPPGRNSRHASGNPAAQGAARIGTRNAK